MPREFGEWLGSWGTIPFDDPGEWVAPKKKQEEAPAEPEWPFKNIRTLLDVGYTYSHYADNYSRRCINCGKAISVGALFTESALRYIRAGEHHPHFCYRCNPKGM